MRTIKIKSDGMGYNTKVFNHNNQEITGITAIDIEIRPDALNKATLTFIDVELDINAALPKPPNFKTITSAIVKWWVPPR